MTTILAFVVPGGSEMLIIILILILLFGAKKLPDLARGMGRSLGEFRKAKEEFDDEVKAGESGKSGKSTSEKKEPVSSSTDSD